MFKQQIGKEMKERKKKVKKQKSSTKSSRIAEDIGFDKDQVEDEQNVKAVEDNQPMTGVTAGAPEDAKDNNLNDAKLELIGDELKVLEAKPEVVKEQDSAKQDE